MALKLSGEGQISNLVGQVCFFCMTVPPAGFLKANGALVSRTTYAELFAVIGTTYGAGDGSTTFALPDLRGEFVRGLDDGRGVDSGRGIGTTQAGQNEAHGHALEVYRNTLGSSGSTNPGTSLSITGTGNATSSQAWQETDKANVVGRVRVKDNQGGGTEARPRNVALLACIKF